MSRRLMELGLDEADYDTVQNAIGVRQSFESWPDAVSAAEEWKTGDPLADGSNIAALAVAEICRGWLEMLDMEVLSRPREEHFTAALAAIKRILAEPSGCPFCDSGKLRTPNNPAKGHNDDCGYGMAEKMLASLPERKDTTSAQTA